MVNESSLLYVLRLLSWCIEDHLVDTDVLDKWLLDRLLEIFGKPSIDRKIQGSWSLDAVFLPPTTSDIEKLITAVTKHIQQVTLS